MTRKTEIAIVLLFISISTIILNAPILAATSMEPPLEEILDTLNFNVTDVDQEVFEPGCYEITLHAEYAWYRNINNLSWYEVGTNDFNLIFSGPEGEPMGLVDPPVMKNFSTACEFGLSMWSGSGHRWYTETNRNGDGKAHAKIYKSQDDPNLFFIGFENLDGGTSDWDYNDMVIGLKRGWSIKPGLNVTVYPQPELGLVFENVTETGDLDVERNSPLPPELYLIPLEPWFNITVTATFSGGVIVSIEYDDEGLCWFRERHLRLWQFDAFIDGDVNFDGLVNCKDLWAILRAWRKCRRNRDWNPNCDVNGDGVVNCRDYLICLKHFGERSWTDITTRIDMENNIIYGETENFSIFGVHFIP